jgi:DNA-binding winged helix-turn-helix (wHTH) protein/TolB-like protein
MRAKRSYDFGPFHLDPDERRLLHGNQPVALTPKCFDLLVIFVENSGHLLTKEELLGRLWPEQFVEEANLSFNISTLRKALGEGKNGLHFIETVPKKGFRFVAHVEERRSDSTELPAKETTEQTKLEHIQSSHSTTTARFPVSLKVTLGLITASALLYLGYNLWARPSESTVPKPARTIAVLPFKPLSTESRDESLEMGMTNALITKLSSINQLVVRPMSTVRKYTDVQQDPIKAGEEVQAEAVLDGSIQKVGDQVRVTCRLINVKNGAAIWADQFDASFTDILNVQDSISQRLIQALTLKLSGKEREQLNKHYTDNSEAYQLYLQGNYLFTKPTGDRGDNLRKSLDYYQQAVEKDPKFAKAYIGISEFYISGGDPKTPSWERILKAKAAIVKALELDTTLDEAYNARAELKYQYEFDWSGAEADFKQALDLNPNNSYFHIAYSWHLMCQGRFDEAQAQLTKSQDLDPGSLRINKTQGILFLFRRQYDKAIGHYQRMREIEPTLIHRNQWSMSVMYEQLGMHSEAVEQFLEDGRMREFLKPEEIEALRKAFTTSGWQSYVRMRLDLLENKSKKEYVAPTTLGGIYALAGEKDLAFASLEKAIDLHDGWVSLIKIQPAYDSLRSDSRFARLLQRVNLTP